MYYRCQTIVKYFLLQTRGRVYLFHTILIAGAAMNQLIAGVSKCNYIFCKNANKHIMNNCRLAHAVPWRNSVYWLHWYKIL